MKTSDGVLPMDRLTDCELEIFGNHHSSPGGGDDIDGQLTVTVVDDDPSTLTALSRVLRGEGLSAETYSSPRQFLETYDPTRVGCLILDVTLPELSGLDLQQSLCEKGNAPPVIFLTGMGGIPDTVRAMKQGAVDFLTKPVDAVVLLAAVRTALEQERAARQARLELLDLQSRLRSLTPREREVLGHVVSGQLNKQTASDLGTVEKTIKVHRARVMEKMRAESLAELVRLAERVGIVGTQNHPPMDDA